MHGPRSSESNLRPWHGLVEHYTPDGSLGRLLLAASSGTVGGSALFIALDSIVQTLPFWPVIALVAGGVGFAFLALTAVVLWPVYLSLIGNVESASAYPEGGSVERPDRTAAESDDAVTVLKRRYAAGDISEAEFERRLDDLLGFEAVLDSSPRSHGDAEGREAERN